MQNVLNTLTWKESYGFWLSMRENRLDSENIQNEHPRKYSHSCYMSFLGLPEQIDKSQKLKTTETYHCMIQEVESKCRQGNLFLNVLWVDPLPAS